MLVPMKAEFIQSEGPLLLATVDLDVYSMTSLLKVAHKFTDRCYLHLQGAGERTVEVRFRSKKAESDCSDIVGAFFNELLDQTLREFVGTESEPVRNLILAHALSNTTLLHPELETAEPF